METLDKSIGGPHGVYLALLAGLLLNCEGFNHYTLIETELYIQNNT